jgi:hypothetical protein
VCVEAQDDEWVEVFGCPTINRSVSGRRLRVGDGVSRRLLRGGTTGLLFIEVLVPFSLDHDVPPDASAARLRGISLTPVNRILARKRASSETDGR